MSDKSKGGGARKSREKGVRTQTMVTLRMDNENVAWLDAETEATGKSKGRIINEALQEARSTRQGKQPRTLGMLRDKLLGVLVFLDELRHELMAEDLTEYERPRTQEDAADEEGYYKT